MIDLEEARDRIGDKVISTFPDNEGDVGVLTRVNLYGIVFVRFPSRPERGTYARNLNWADSGGDHAQS